MKKRLRFAMPNVPLSTHRKDKVNEKETTQYGTSNVGTMARIINNSNRKRKEHNCPPEVAADADLSETSESEEEVFNEHSSLIQH